MDKGFLFIFNQAAGKKKKDDITKIIMDKANASGIDSDHVYLVYSTSVTSSQFLIDRFEQGYPDGVVIACGGDGTVNSIGNIVINTQLIFSILPLGTGNDLYAGLYEGRSIPDQLTAIFTNDYQETDAIFVPEVNHYVMNIASVGVDATVVNEANNMKESMSLFKDYAYMLSVPKALRKGTGFNIQIQAKQGNERLDLAPGPYILAAICNGNKYGGGFNVNPTGKSNDGIMELVFAPELPIRRILPLIYKFFSGNHEGVKEIHKVSCDWVKYTSLDGKDMVVNFDGEIHLLSSFTAQVKPGAYKRII